ncbi:oxidoreductase [Nitrogeniibacter mangrovi]|uniref:Oxidoreductase n=2 Tax=Nitrogeniibacter mangrovi TaxID=2016596 RepID=A0A6C1B8X1_9RHOO|nr:oxidoreductase [Nitrogeniibacter mangrovi]
MKRVSRVLLPMLVLALVGGPVWWAWPGTLGGWRSVAIVTGWLGYGLLFASLVTMLREPWLARVLGGLGRMYAWHHHLGVLAYLVLLLHPVALAMEALPESPAIAWASVAPLQQGAAGWLGWAALLCLMIGLGVALSPRLAYGRWRALHGLLALAVVVSPAHLVMLGLEQWLWWMPVLAIGVLFWRVLRADCGLAALPHVVAQVAHPARAVVEITLRPMARALAAHAGQFVLVAFHDGPHFQGCHEYHPFTLTAIEPDGSLRVGIKALGDCTRHMQTLEAGVAARVQGPFGDFGAAGSGRPALWIAGGIGIAPFMALLRAGTVAAPVRLIYLYREAADGAYHDELVTLADADPDVTLVAHASGDGAPDLAAILPEADALAGVECFLCGPPGLVDAAVALLRARGAADEHIHFERFEFR